jgi:hypothetical protein
MKDGACGMTGDGSFAARRTGCERGSGDGRNVSWQKPLVNKKGRGPGWKIPEFPKGWATAFGPKLFKILEDWRHCATWEQTLAKELNYKFSLYMEHPSGTQDKKKNNQKQKQSNQKWGRRTQSQQNGMSRNDDLSSQGATDAGSGKGSTGNKKKQIYLQHSGRVVTETNQ